MLEAWRRSHKATVVSQVKWLLYIIATYEFFHNMCIRTRCWSLFSELNNLLITYAFVLVSNIDDLRQVILTIVLK